MSWSWDHLPQMSGVEAQAHFADTDLVTVAVPKDVGTSQVDELVLFANTRGLLALITSGTEIDLPHSDSIVLPVDEAGHSLASNDNGDLLRAAHITDTIAALAYQMQQPVVVSNEAVVLPDGGVILLQEAPRRWWQRRQSVHPTLTWAREFAHHVYYEPPPRVSTWTWNDSGEAGEFAELLATPVGSDLIVSRANERVLALAPRPGACVDYMTNAPDSVFPVIAAHHSSGGMGFVVVDRKRAGSLVIPINLPSTLCPPVPRDSPAGQLLGAATVLRVHPWNDKNPTTDDPRIEQILTVQQHLPLADIEARARAVAATVGFLDEFSLAEPRLPFGARHQTYRPGRTAPYNDFEAPAMPLVVNDVAQTSKLSRRAERKTLRDSIATIAFGVFCFLVGIGIIGGCWRMVSARTKWTRRPA